VMLRDTIALIQAVFQATHHRTIFDYQGQTIDLAPPWHRITVAQAFQQWAGWNPVETWDEERFERDLVRRVEPALPRGKPCVLCDYPAPAAALARLKPGDPRVAERWEVYIGGLELANAYSELCDAEQQRERFRTAARQRAHLGKCVYPIDEPFLRDLARGMPPCGGIALGIDRLVMLVCNADDIAEIRPFCQRPGECY